MSDMIERVAQAIRAASGQALSDAAADEDFWTTLNPEADRYRTQARAAIAAMRDPTPTMENAAEDTEMNDDDGRARAPFIVEWRAAIDTALLQR